MPRPLHSEHTLEGQLAGRNWRRETTNKRKERMRRIPPLVRRLAAIVSSYVPISGARQAGTLTRVWKVTSICEPKTF